MHGEQVLIGFDRTEQGKLEIVGFSATKVDVGDIIEDDGIITPRRRAYFAAAAIAKSHQGTGLYGHLNDRRMDFVEERQLDVVATRTQNPRVEQGITLSLEKMVQAQRIRAFTIARQVIQGAYGGMLTDVRPVASRVTYDNIDYERGDANLITWRLHL
jgi:hypothetical protein